MQRLEVSGAVRPIYGSLGVKRLIFYKVVWFSCLPFTFFSSVRKHTQLSTANDVSQMLYQSITFIFKHLCGIVILKSCVRGLYTSICGNRYK